MTRKTTSHHLRSQHIHGWWFGINTWKILKENQSNSWNMLKLHSSRPKHFFHGFDSTCTLTQLDESTSALQAHLPTYRKCCKLSEQNILSYCELFANGSTSTAMGSFPSHIQQVVKSPILRSWVVSAISTEFSWNLPWQTDVFSQHWLSRSFQTSKIMCHNVPQKLWSNLRLTILFFCAFYCVKYSVLLSWKQHTWRLHRRQWSMKDLDGMG